MSRPIRAPRHLSAAARKLYADVMATFVLEAHHVAVLTKALEAFDRAEQARAIIALPPADALDPTAPPGGGLVVRSRLGEHKAHPAIAIERDSRSAFYAGIRQLGLDVETPTNPRRGDDHA